MSKALITATLVVTAAGFFGMAVSAQVPANPRAADLQKWAIHDDTRPMPPVVDPGPAGPPAPVPSDAIVLFDGRDLSGWTTAKGEPAKWLVRDGYMEVVKGAGARSRRSAGFGDCQLHVEWAAPAPPVGSGQDRGNSGVFLMNTYEVQVLDSYESKTYADGMAAALYGQFPPLVNASRKPGEWQTYDIVFHAPRFDAERRGGVAGPDDRLPQRHPGARQRRTDRADGAQGAPAVQGARGQAAASGCRTTATRCGSATSGSANCRTVDDLTAEDHRRHDTRLPSESPMRAARCSSSLAAALVCRRVPRARGPGTAAPRRRC